MGLGRGPSPVGPVHEGANFFLVRLLLVAPPGAGKGTQAQRLADHYGITHLSSGDLLRQQIAEGSEIGKKVVERVRSGDLVPDDLILGLLREPLIEAARRGGYVLDGFPRNVRQAEAAYRMAREIGSIELQAVVHLDVPPEELTRRLRLREDRESRIDDADDVVAHRLDVFVAETEPLVAFYRQRGIVLEVDGNQEVEAVFSEIVAGLERRQLSG
jgi:adenylate kinase